MPKRKASEMLLTYRYRIYPTKKQTSLLTSVFSVACFLYNHSLAYRRKKWRESRCSVTYYEQSAMWRDWRNEYDHLRILNMSAGQQVLRRLDKAYKEFLKGKRGKPRFQKASRFNSINFKPGDGAQVKNNRLYIQNVGLIKVRWHRLLPECKLKNIIVLRKSSGWYVLLQIEVPDIQIIQSNNLDVGIDIGIAHALALSDGTIVDSPRYLQKSLKKLRRLQRSLSRKKKGSNRRKKAVKKVSRIQEHIANQRLDFWHKTTNQLIAEYGVFYLEDLNLGFMLRNHHLSRVSHDTGLGIFRSLLGYKAVKAGALIRVVNPKNTSQICSSCGCIVQKALSVRVHVCPECGLTLDRGVNAARNILLLGRSSQALTQPVGVFAA